MSPAAMRKRVTPGEFLAWLVEVPWVELPEALVTWEEVEAAGMARPAAGGPPATVVPPAVAVSLATHAAAASSVMLRLRGPDGDVHVIVSLLADQAAGLARSVHPTGDSVYPTGDSVYPTGDSVYPTGDSVYPTGDLASAAGSGLAVGSGPGQPVPDWVEVSLLPAAGAAAEVLRWVPPAFDGPTGQGATVQVAVVAADDAVWRWFEAWQRSGDGWRRLPPDGASGPWGEAAGPMAPVVPPAVMRMELERSLHRVLARDGAGHG